MCPSTYNVSLRPVGHGHPTSRHMTTYTLYVCEIDCPNWKFNMFYHVVMVRVVMVRLRVVMVMVRFRVVMVMVRLRVVTSVGEVASGIT